jgi:hypothetical protein
MNHPQLIVNADATILARQIESWSEIIQVSDHITEQAKENNWDDILSLAEERDKKVERFLNNGVCQEILPQISDDLEAIKEQHLAIMTGIKHQQNRVNENESSLEKIKKEIALSLPNKK